MLYSDKWSDGWRDSNKDLQIHRGKQIKTKVLRKKTDLFSDAKCYLFHLRCPNYIGLKTVKTILIRL